MKYRNLVALVSIIIVFNLLLVSTALARLYVKPAKLGVIRLEIFPFSPATVTKSFEVGNLYNFTIKVNLATTGNITDITSLSKSFLILEPNETEAVDCTISVKEPGVYSGGISVSVLAENRTASLAYQADLIVFATPSEMTTGLIAPIIAVLALVVIFVYMMRKRFRK
jgi:hypothetical protein